MNNDIEFDEIIECDFIEITELDDKAYNLYILDKECKYYKSGNLHHMNDFISDKNDYSNYYLKAKIELRKDKLKKISKEYYD